MSTLRFQIQHSNGREEQVTVEAERALIGSGAHCEIRLPIDQAAVEHILIQVGAGGVFAQALNFEPSPTIGGVAFTQAPLPADVVLGVNQTQMLVSITGDVVGGAGGGRPKQKSNPMVLIAGMLGASLLAYMSSSTRATRRASSPRSSPSCGIRRRPHAREGPRRGRGLRRREAQRGRRQARAPHVPREGRR